MYVVADILTKNFPCFDADTLKYKYNFEHIDHHRAIPIVAKAPTSEIYDLIRQADAFQNAYKFAYLERVRDAFRNTFVARSEPDLLRDRYALTLERVQNVFSVRLFLSSTVSASIKLTLFYVLKVAKSSTKIHSFPSMKLDISSIKGEPGP